MTNKEQYLVGEQICKYYSREEIQALIDYKNLSKSEPFLNKCEEIRLKQSKKIINDLVE